MGCIDDDDEGGEVEGRKERREKRGERGDGRRRVHTE